MADYGLHWWRRLVVVGWAVLSVGCGESPVVPLSAEQTGSADSAVHLSSATLQERFRVTPHASNSELGGRVIEVTGTVVLVGISPDLGDVVLLSGGGKGTNPVVCQMAMPRPWDALTPGIPVTIKGQVSRVQPGSAALLRQAHVIHVDSATAEAARFTATDLTGSFAESRANAAEVLGDRWVRVSGAVASIDRINNWLYLSGLEGRMVRCALAGKDDELSWDQDLDRGENIEVVGQVFDGDGRQVILQGCLPPRRNDRDATPAEGPVEGAGRPSRDTGLSVLRVGDR
ncbi:MAG: OB-fold protein [Planctomycetaceae bacterium]